MINKYEYSIF